MTTAAGAAYRITIESFDEALEGILEVSTITVGRRSGDVTLARRYAGIDELAQWRQRIVDGIIDRRYVSIEVVGSDGSVQRRYALMKAFPSKWVLPALDLSGDAVERITLSTEGIVEQT